MDMASETTRAKTADRSEPASQVAFDAEGEQRFRALLGETQWQSLPPAVRRRFSKCISAGESVVYTGEVREIRYWRAGWVLANILRVVGAPLPLCRKAGGVSVVAVTQDARSNGQFWTRLFAREGAFPQVIKSSKRFSGPTGIEEAIGFGIVMALTVSARLGVLTFESAGYFLEAGSWRLRIPRLLTPGTLTVSHAEIDDVTFLFSLHLQHSLFGELVHQDVVYREDL